MRILAACEESQAVCIEMRRLGHEAYSCDIEPCSGGHPEWHIQADALPLINGNCTFTDSGGGATPYQRPMGYADRLPAMHLHDQRLGSSDASEGRDRPREIRQSDGGKRVLPAVLECRLPPHSHREPNAHEADRPPALHPGDPAVATRTPIHQEDVPLAQGPPAAGTIEHHNRGHPALRQRRMQRCPWELPALSRPE